MPPEELAISNPDTADSNAVFCESCGYRLDGLSPKGRCPECGTAIVDSLTGRELTVWEVEPTWRSFVKTVTAVVRGPTGFFRSLRTVVDDEHARQSRRFQWRCLLICTALGFVAVYLHQSLFGKLIHIEFPGPEMESVVLALAGLAVAGLFIKVVEALSVWEANFRGMRLEEDAARRALQYHTACLLPVALLFTLLTVATTIASLAGAEAYLLVTPYIAGLCGLVVGGGIYLFATYWIAMRNMLHANS